MTQTTQSEKFRVLALGGDHIGPEVVAAGIDVLRHVADLANIQIEIEEDLLGGASWDKHGTFCTDAVVQPAKPMPPWWGRSVVQNGTPSGLRGQSPKPTD